MWKHRCIRKECSYNGFKSYGDSILLEWAGGDAPETNSGFDRVDEALTEMTDGS